MATNYAIDLNWIHHRLILWIDPRCWMVCLLFFASGKSRNNDNLSIDWKCIRECQRASAYRPVWRMYAQKKKKNCRTLCVSHQMIQILLAHILMHVFFRDINHFPSRWLRFNRLLKCVICASCASTQLLCDYFQRDKNQSERNRNDIFTEFKRPIDHYIKAVAHCTGHSH